MKNYHITFYFSDKVNFETFVPSELELNDFVLEFNNKLQSQNTKFVNFIGDDIKKVSVNLDNVLFYVID